MKGCEQVQRGLTLVYRGQLEIERSRIEFLLKSVSHVTDYVDFVHLSPGLGVDEKRLHSFMRDFLQVRNVSFIPASTARLLDARRRLRRVIASDAGSVVAVGFSAWPFVSGLDCLAWCINGIPEERLLTADTPQARMAARASWLGARLVRPALTVVVSERMAKLVSERIRSARILVVPNAVDRSVYEAQTSEPVYLTYQGGASPWQGLDRLAEVWAAIHSLDPSLRFRVISNDPRARVLAHGLLPEVVEFASSDSAHGVAQLLAEARLGFLFRAKSLVNEVSWPMKLGEYLAAGAPVVVSNCGWDLAGFVEEHEAGLVLEWGDPAIEIAQTILSYMRQIGDHRPVGVMAAAEALDSSSWQRVVADALTHAQTEKENSGV